MASPYIFFNGRVLSAEQVAISPFDIGLLRGYAVFDLLRTVGGRPFLLAEHLRRLHRQPSSSGSRCRTRTTRSPRAIDELLHLNCHAEATVRLVLTGGTSPTA